MTTTSAGNGIAIPPIPITMVMTTEVSDVGEEEATVRATYDSITIDDAGLPREAVRSFEEATSALEGVAVTFVYDPSGQVLDTTVDLPDDAPPTVQQLVDQLTSSLSGVGMVFPAEPIGIGATWRTASTVETTATTVSQTSTYTLEDLDGSSYRISVQTDGTVEAPGGTGGTGGSTGSITNAGEFEGTLDQVVPLHATSHGTTSLQIDANGQQVELVNEIDLTLTTEAG